MNTKQEFRNEVKAALMCGPLNELEGRIDRVIDLLGLASLNFKLVGLMIDGAVRTLYNADANDFNEIFGDGGPHLWEKFCLKARSEGEFICSLDAHNLELLARAAFERNIPDRIRQETMLKEAIEKAGNSDRRD